MLDAGTAWVGTPDDINQQLGDYIGQVGGFDVASLQVNFNRISFDDAEGSVRLFARAALPNFAGV